jgi:hypothetical protein
MAGMCSKEVAYVKCKQNCVTNLKGMYHFGDPSKNRRAILQWIFKTWGMRLQTKFVWLRRGSRVDLL